MNALLFCTLIAVPPTEFTEPRSYREIQNDYRAAFREHIQADKDVDRATAVKRMLLLHAEIVEHPNFLTSSTLKQYRAQIWARLQRVKNDIEKRERRQTWQGRPRGGRGVRDDYGPLLVALIERTIAPEFWDVNGGPGTIVYYRPLRVLVVHATIDVHHRIGGVIGKL
jgi:hypothetical protein